MEEEAEENPQWPAAKVQRKHTDVRRLKIGMIILGGEIGTKIE